MIVFEQKQSRGDPKGSELSCLVLFSGTYNPRLDGIAYLAKTLYTRMSASLASQRQKTKGIVIFMRNNKLSTEFTDWMNPNSTYLHQFLHVQIAQGMASEYTEPDKSQKALLQQLPIHAIRYKPGLAG